MAKVNHNQSRIREALTAGTNVKEKGPQTPDGFLSVTPDTPDIVEWRSKSLDIAETSSTYLDDDDDGPKPHELYGKFTWKIENFSEISKRELRSNVFDVGNYKWYILVYPQGCDVCNHLSLFLCVADYDKLLPGWSHFAQFTIAVVNKDPKKSKYSDTLHRFCKKEHDWGWKKFMELSKVLDGFTVADTLVIKAQVQVILDKPGKPFRCLDPQYRRELVRVYLTNVEGICRRFCEDKRTRLSWAKDEVLSFKQFWSGLSAEQQRKLMTDKCDAVLKGLVKQFFNEKEVTSTLVMDALYSGCKQIEEHSRLWLEGKCPDSPPIVLIKAEKGSMHLCGDLLDTADKITKDFIPAAKDDNKILQPNDGLTLRSGQEGDDYRRDSIERDEKRLAELGRRTVEMFAIAHIFSERLEIAYREAEALKRQDQLIAEEFERAALEESKAQAKAAADKEKKAKKKEKMKAKKEAEKARKEAEEAERKAREDEMRRQDLERRAKEQEKKRQEEAAALAQQQQQAAKAKKGKADKQQPAAKQQQAAKQQGHQQAAASASRQVATSSCAAPQPAAARSSRPPSLSSIAAAAVGAVSGSSDAAGAASTSLHGGSAASERPDRSAVDSDDSSCGEVGTVNQATGVPDSSGDGEDDADSAGGTGGEGDSDGESDEGEERAALQQEVATLRLRVEELEQQLAERDAELFALRAQLAELQPSEIAEMIKDAASARAGAGAAVASDAAASAGTAHAEVAVASSSSAALAGAATAAPPPPSRVSAEGGMPADRAVGAKPEQAAGTPAAMANGPKDHHREPGLLSNANIPAAAAAAAAAAVRRMPPPAPAGTMAHDPSSAAHHHHHHTPAAAGPGRPVGAPAPATLPPRMGAIPAPATAQGSLAVRPPAPHSSEHAVQHHPSGTAAAPQQQQPAAAGSSMPMAVGHASSADTGHMGQMMQRSTSATLPASSAAAAPYTPLGSQLAASASAQANGGRSSRPSGHSMDSGAAPVGAKPGPGTYLAPGAAASSAGGQAAVSANGMAGVLHSAAPMQDSIPSYRNAAAGVLASTSAAPSTHSSMPAAPVVPVASTAAAPTSVLPVSPSSSSSTVKRVEDSSAATASAAAVAAAGSSQLQRHMGHAVGAQASAAADTAGAFGTSARIMMQPAAQRGLQFTPNAAVTPATAPSTKRAAAAAQMDSPGLEDFAHYNMIDDLLTE